jgi:hypothetical protein
MISVPGAAAARATAAQVSVMASVVFALATKRRMGDFLIWTIPYHAGNLLPSCPLALMLAAPQAYTCKDISQEKTRHEPRRPCPSI